MICCSGENAGMTAWPCCESISSCYNLIHVMMKAIVDAPMFYLIVLCMCDVMTHIIDFSVV